MCGALLEFIRVVLHPFIMRDLEAACGLWHPKEIDDKPSPSQLEIQVRDSALVSIERPSVIGFEGWKGMCWVDSVERKSI